ncbi:MAG: gliding motility-associated C-terminal domain-containing protein [Bacteroidales bacterium]|nr:gliding motility-associated C-terminal domain-containing protein [Bacteroidales bacterium]
MQKTGIILFLLISFFSSFLKAEDYYWVGGKGNWSDLDHWKFSDGQTPNEVPDANDNVIFNENSFIAPFDTVFIFTVNPTCKNMSWANIMDTVVFAGGYNTYSFDIFGSVTMHPRVRNIYKGKITLLSDEPGNTITSASTVFHGDLVFEGNGEWILQDTLIVLDTTEWEYYFYDQGAPSGQNLNLTIQHVNGRLDVNGQTIISRNFITSGNNPRELDLENGHVMLLGSWTLNGENLIFNGNLSYILIGISMNNLNGNEIHYYDIDVMAGEGSIMNTAIRTFHRKVHFFGSGAIFGNNNVGTEGMFTIDTLIFSGEHGPGTISPVYISGPSHNIHYTRIDSADGHFNVNEGYFHRIDFNGFYNSGIFEVSKSDFIGLDNTVDSCIFYQQPGSLIGRNTVNDVLFFKAEGIVSAESQSKNVINHVVFSSNGYIKGSNDFTRMTLSTGYWYQFQADSLIHPGSYFTNTFIQTIEQIDVLGDCSQGVTMLTSGYKPNQAIIDYTGAPLTAGYLMIKDIKNIGQSLEVINGIDAGNNEGILFTGQLLPRTLYWVNGQGDWDSPYHWSLISGGIGDQCPPTILDDVFFNLESAFSNTEDTVLVNLPHIHCNNMTWVDGFTNVVHFVSGDTITGPFYNDSTTMWEIDTVVVAMDTCALHIYGSIELDPALAFKFEGDVHFESEYDDEYEIIDIEWISNRYNLLNKAFFNGMGGKWKLKEGTKFYNLEDSVNFRMGELQIIDGTVEVFNFISIDTLPRRLSLLDKTLFVVHQWGVDAWNINASPGLNGDTLFHFDAGKSTIRSIGDRRVLSPPGGQCHIRTFGGGLDYNNIEFGFAEFTTGEFSILKSESKCSYNLVDFYQDKSRVTGTGIIDTLTWKETSSNSSLRDTMSVNFLFSYAENNSIINSHEIDTAMFYGQGYIEGTHSIGYLEAHKSMAIQSLNYIDTAILYGNTIFLGKNTFSQLVLSPNNRYIFQHETNFGLDTTTINDDFVVNGYCDQPIRLQSDSTGTRAKILYKAQNPTYQDFTANYVSIRDIAMLPYGGNEYIATNAVDLGNNENWEFIETNDNTYFWIGGQGNWGDWQRWSYSSGGSPIEDQCIPREINTVVFDNNSFENPVDTVFVDIGNIYCKNMWWKHDGSLFNPAFISTDTSVLFIYGSIMLNDSMDFKYKGEVYFDQYNELNDQPDTIYSKGNIFLNDVYLQGINDIIIMDDSMTLETGQSTVLHHNHGTFSLNGNHLRTGAYHSIIKSPRTLNMENSRATVQFNSDRAWWIEGDNFELLATNSTLTNKSVNGTIITKNGSYFKYNNIIVDGPVDSLYNKNNIVEYNVVDLRMDVCLVAGNFIADSILLNGNGSGIFDNSTTNVVMVNAINASVNNNHQVNRCIVNKQGKIKGNNNIGYCVFFDDGYFLGQNVFDTLVLYSGEGDLNNQGNWFYFQVDSTQTIVDSLYIRGNQCSNMNLSTFPPNSSNIAYLRKDDGYDVSCDYLNIYNVGTTSANDLTFYAGINSNPLPNPDNPPPGWVFDNAQGYVTGFNGKTEHFCLGDSYVIDATSFNGDPSTLYFWEGSQFPGGLTYTVTEPGLYHIRVQYYEGCDIEDFIIIEGDLPPEASIATGPFCEGDPIEVYVSPGNGEYAYEWFNDETTATIEATLDYSGGIYVTVTDLSTSCNTTTNQLILVKPTPDPELSLGDDVTIKHGESITLDAGSGDYYEWTSTPLVQIENPDQQNITVTGYTDPVEYNVYVEIEGCPAEGYKTISMYPPNKLGIPTAFSPNGDGDNDLLNILGSGFDQVDFKIFNRYGQLVFETSDPAVGWDGTFKGKKQEVDVYTYFIKVVYVDKSVVKESGNISLLR